MLLRNFLMQFFFLLKFVLFIFSAKLVDKIERIKFFLVNDAHI